MSFRVERKFSLLILEEGEEYIADVSATMTLVRKGQEAQSKGRLRVGSRSLLFQPDEVSASILKFPYRHLRTIGDVEPAGSFPVQCEQCVQVATKTAGAETRIVTPFSILKSKMAVNFHVHYASAAEYVRRIRQLWEAATLGTDKADAVVRRTLAEVTADVAFDTSRLGHRESPLLATSHMWVRRVKPLLEVRGLLQISNEAIYFQPHPNFSSKPVKRVPLEDVLHVFRRTYGVQAKALEIITVHYRCLYLTFEAQSDCDLVAQILQEHRPQAGQATASQPPQQLGLGLGGHAEGALADIRRMTALWQSGLLSSFHYLDFLNCAAGRSQNDFSQYPVFPWVLQDYRSEQIDLSDPAVYRDLTKPVGALSSKRLAYFKERMHGMPDEERFLYGTHYSTPAYVIHWLLRSMPERMLRLHSGHFDSLPRLFRSLRESWDSVMDSTASLMELIPEFFTLPADWLENTLGIATAEGPLADVLLPAWAADKTDFVCKMRAALEGEWASRHLPSWIDLIFGCKQSGEAAVKADNLFHPVCYTGARGGPPAAASGLPTAVLETQLQEFGRMPRQLFDEAHPPRLKIPHWDPGCLREDPMHSEPWYNAVRHIAAGAEKSLGEAQLNGQGNSPTGPIATPLGRPENGAAVGPVAGAAVGSSQSTLASLRATAPRLAVSFAASGRIAGLAASTADVYSISEDGCLRVSPLTSRPDGPGRAATGPTATSMRRNFRISSMPLSALAMLGEDLLAIGGHDNAVTLYSSSCGSTLSKCQAHADTVTCLAVGPRGSGVVASGSRDQSVRAMLFTPSSLRSETTFDDIQQPVSCVAASSNLILAGAVDGQLVAWDRRSSQLVLDRELSSPAVACTLHSSEHSAMALDGSGELRLWDLRQSSESLRLVVAAPRASRSSLASVSSFMTDFTGWAIVGGAREDGRPAVSLWAIPDQRELCTWTLEERSQSGEVPFLLPMPGWQEESDVPLAPFICATPGGSVYVFEREAPSMPA